MDYSSLVIYHHYNHYHLAPVRSKVHLELDAGLGRCRRGRRRRRRCSPLRRRPAATCQHRLQPGARVRAQLCKGTCDVRRSLAITRQALQQRDRRRRRAAGLRRRDEYQVRDDDTQQSCLVLHLFLGQKGGKHQERLDAADDELQVGVGAGAVGCCA